MIAQTVSGKAGYTAFTKAQQAVYRDNPCFRGTENSVEKMLIAGPTAFHQHAEVKAFLLQEAGKSVGRFALIHDERRPEDVMVSFFEAQPGLEGVVEIIREEVRRFSPSIDRFVIGLNGHLNYGAGLLTNQFDRPPLFGLPYSPAYYRDYFSTLTPRRMYSFRLPVAEFSKWSQSYPRLRTQKGLTVRFMEKKHIQRDIAIYTELNNRSFQQHPYWADRSPSEDLELFYPFRFLMDNENLIFAEINGKPVGFCLWYPDFNQLVHSQRDLNIWDVFRFRLLKPPIDTCRFTEIGILPNYVGSAVALAMLDKALSVIQKAGYPYCEIGFIFEENKPSINLCQRLLKRCGLPTDPYREFVVYEGDL